ncbi:DUF4232 domain-containing protein [Streptomyces sp. KL2]|uniref:DUF4232 domain-containing protein n=1 Tax=Streptomyces sp. KL2 TaxID=3050126 RepID=UPI00397E4683
MTKVPASEAPAEPGTCPASGIRVSADKGDAAMGLRVVGMHLENCGTRDYTVQGYPLMKLLDHGMKPADGIEILDGSGEITTGTGPDEPRRPVTLGPGETATAGLVWRNTTKSGTPVNVPYVQVRAKAGAAPVIPGLGLGTTRKLGVSPWKKAEEQQGGTAGTSGRAGRPELSPRVWPSARRGDGAVRTRAITRTAKVNHTSTDPKTKTAATVLRRRRLA